MLNTHALLVVAKLWVHVVMPVPSFCGCFTSGNFYSELVHLLALHPEQNLCSWWKLCLHLFMVGLHNK